MRESARPPRTRNIVGLACAMCLALALGSCSVDRYLQADRPLYGGSEIEIVNPDAVPDAAELETRLASFVQQEESGKIGMWWWFKLEPQKPKGAKNFLRDKLGTEPEYYSAAQAERTELLMRDYLKDHGYFGADLARDTTHLDTAHVRVDYTVEAAGRARIDTVVWPIDSSTAFGRFLAEVKPTRFAQEDDYYSVAALDAERARIDQLSARKGFFEVSTSNIFYIVDSTGGGPFRTEVFMRLDEGRDSLAFARFTVGNTYVFPNYSPLDSTAFTDTTAYPEGVYVIRNAEQRLHDGVVARRIGLREGDVYDQRIYENTINQLLDLGVFRFVDYRFERRLTDTTPVLDQYVYLTQGQSQRVTADVEATTRNQGGLGGGGSFGLGVSAGYTNTNFFNGAEDFSVDAAVSAGPQTEIRLPQTGEDGEPVPFETVIASEYAVGAELALPRLVAPFARDLERRAFYIPRTLTALRYQQVLREEFTLRSASLRLGYRYRASRLVTHELYPVSVNYSSLSNESAPFVDYLAANPRVARSLSDNAIAGAEYVYRYSDQGFTTSKDYWVIEAGLRTSGNVASLFATEGASGQLEVAGVRLSQFAKLYGDLRRTWLFGESSFATRLFAGAGIPYGSTPFLPFVEQFFVGGPNSVRAFQLRGVGPGAVEPVVQGDNQAIGGGSLDQTGDIRLELNGEYRFPVWGFLEGATFVDVGNVWLARSTPENPEEGVFDPQTFAQQLAVGTGIGLRLDFDILIVRLDVATPVRKPWLSGSDAWTPGNLNILDAEAREDLRFHIAIGYPF